jgi:hypothetical protein
MKFGFQRAMQPVRITPHRLVRNSRFHAIWHRMLKQLQRSPFLRDAEGQIVLDDGLN